MGISTAVDVIKKEKLFESDEAFFTGTAVEVTPVTCVTDGSKENSPSQEFTIGTGQKGPITQQIMDIYFDTVRGKVERYDDWLTYVND